MDGGFSGVKSEGKLDLSGLSITSSMVPVV